MLTFLFILSCLSAAQQPGILTFEHVTTNTVYSQERCHTDGEGHSTLIDTAVAVQHRRRRRIKTIDQETTTWLRKHSHPIRSLISENYKDLQLLKPLLAGKRIVQLGESSHGVAEFNMVKVRLIKFLHEELGFDVIAFESGLFECYEANNRAADALPIETMQHCIFGVWHTEEVLKLFEYIQQTRRSTRPLTLAGFDVQPSAAGLRYRPAFFRNVVATVDSAFAEEVYRTDSAFVEVFRHIRGRPEAYEAYRSREASHLDSTYRALFRFISAHEDKIGQSDASHPSLPLMARQAAWSAMQNAVLDVARSSRRHSGTSSVTEIRDKAMADNLNFLLTFYPGKKIIVWGHNFHLRHNNEWVDLYRDRTMGSFLAERYPDELYTIGLYMYQGTAALNNRKTYRVSSMRPNGLEDVLHRARMKYLFIDMSEAERSDSTSWIYRPIIVREWGRRELQMVMKEQYDGLIFIDTVTSPAYLPRRDLLW